MKKITAILTILILLLALSGCATQTFTVGTASEEGTYFAYIEAMDDVLQDKADTALEAFATEGSRENIRFVDVEGYDFGIAQSDALAYAWDGLFNFRIDGNVDSIRAVGSLYTEAVHLIGTNKIKTAADLKGAKLGIGKNYAGMYYSAYVLSEALGLDTESDVSFEYILPEEMGTALAEGTIDAALFTGGAPIPMVEDALAQGDLHLISLEQTLIDQILERSKGTFAATIPANTYRGQTEEIQTIGVRAVLFCNADLPKEDVYFITEALFTNAPESAHPLAKQTLLEDAAKEVHIPFHQGAAKYFSEQGIHVKYK